MDDDINEGGNKQIVKLLGLLFFSALFAFSLVAYFVYLSETKGEYKIKNVLLNPDTLSKSSLIEIHPQTLVKTHYSFEKLELRYVSSISNKWESKLLNIDQYRSIFNLLKADTNLKVSEKEILYTFPKLDDKISLIFSFKPRGSFSEMPVLLYVDFFKKYGLYRVELREDGQLQKFAYFKHEKIFNKLSKQFSL